MLAKCFYLLAVLTTVVSFSFTNVTLFPEGIDLPLGGLNLKVRNIVPHTLDWPSTNLSSTSDALSFTLDNPLSAVFSLQVRTLFFWTPAKLQLTLNGGAAFSKNAGDTCDSEDLVRSYCDLKAHVIIRGILTNAQIADVAVDVCNEAESLLKSTLAARKQESLPTLAPGATDISRLQYFRKFTLLNGLSESLDLPSYNKFIAKNAMQVSTGLALPLSFDFDTSDPNTSTTIDTATSIVNAIKKLLHITIYDNVTDATTTIAFQGGNVTMPSLKNLMNQIATKEARAALKAYVPAGASFVYDVVVNDLQCRLFNTICSIPAENGIQVINSHFTGLGDLGGILNNALGESIDETMTNVTFTNLKKTSILSGGRYYLPLI